MDEIAYFDSISPLNGPGDRSGNLKIIDNGREGVFPSWQVPSNHQINRFRSLIRLEFG